MSPSPPRVLLTVDDYYASLAAVRALRDAGYEPWVAAGARGTYAERSRATAGTTIGPEPAEGAQRYVSFVAETAARIGAAVVLPCTERSLNALAGREEAFPPATVLAAPPPALLARATDKAELARLAGAAGLGAPTTVELGRDDLAARRSELSFPAVLKPAQSTIRVAAVTVDQPPAVRVDSFDELDALLGERPEGRWLVQPFLAGELIAVSGVAWRGELVCACHQVARRIHPPGCGASALAETVVRDEAVERGVAQILGRLGLSGIFELQLIRAAGAAHAIDFNPRVYGSIGLAIAAGLNLPAILVDLVLGREPRAGTYRPGVRLRVEERDVRALLADLRAGRLRAAVAGALPRPGTVHAIWSLRDPAPTLALVAKLRSRHSRRPAGRAAIVPRPTKSK